MSVLLPENAHFLAVQTFAKAASQVHEADDFDFTSILSFFIWFCLNNLICCSLKMCITDIFGDLDEKPKAKETSMGRGPIFNYFQRSLVCVF